MPIAARHQTRKAVLEDKIEPSKWLNPCRKLYISGTKRATHFRDASTVQRRPKPPFIAPDGGLVMWDQNHVDPGKHRRFTGAVPPALSSGR